MTEKSQTPFHQKMTSSFEYVETSQKESQSKQTEILE